MILTFMKALNWATDCGVDVISMSWTIETPVEGNPDMVQFREAVKTAASKNILMTSDQGNSMKDNCYPGGFGGCISIGGATDTGEALSWVNADKVNFLLPGKDFPFVDNKGKIVSHELGSSIATAATLELAGLLVFCSWIINAGDTRFLIRKAWK
jgi:hypothetical protein